jgi:hypothetical protein
VACESSSTRELARGVAELATEEIELGVALEIFGDAADLRAHVRFEGRFARDPQARETMEHHRVVRDPEADDFDHPSDGADVEDVLEAGLVDVRVALAYDADDGAVLTEEILDEPHAARAPYVDGNDARGENHAVTQREEGKGLELGPRILGHGRPLYCGLRPAEGGRHPEGAKREG